MRTRRVGSLTCGTLLILFGVLFILHMLIPAVTFTFIFKLWPLILIFLGIEILLSNIRKTEQKLTYDTGAIFLVIILAFFSLGMGVAEFCISHAPMYISW